MKAALKTIGQVCFFIIVSMAANAVAKVLPVPIPGSILGIFLVFALLQLKIIRLDWIDLGTGWLLSEMLLFFIPSAVSMVQYKEMLVASGPRILLVIVCSTITVMACAGLLAQKLAGHQERKSL